MAVLPASAASSDLRRTERVIRAGRVYDSKTLYEATGLITPKR